MASYFIFERILSKNLRSTLAIVGPRGQEYLAVKKDESIITLQQMMINKFPPFRKVKEKNMYL